MIHAESLPLRPASNGVERRHPVSRPARSGLTRAQILGTARELLREHGYDAVRLEDVARLAGLSRRTIYNQFADKRDLFSACRAAMLAEIVDLLPQLDPRSPAVEGLRAFTDALLALFLSEAHLELAASIFRDRRVGDHMAESYERQVLDPIRRRLEVFLYTKREVGELDCALVGGAAQLLLQLIHAVAAPMSIGPLSIGRVEPSTGAADAIVRYFLDQIARSGVADVGGAKN